ncbi:hypothetical protein [Nitriliruptor alkaliphilus]|uniref:hypothetical protein n=1 Tax=Nitriliruptor alkaliphilus TaxID=427918 RepID=UPI000696D293|nr:hypothetical protein [Nitriliruptor alkaliphilus]
MSARPRRLATAAGLVAAFPLIVGFVGPDHGDPHCDDPIAEVIHEVEEATHIHALHDVEVVYCDNVVPLLP